MRVYLAMQVQSATMHRIVTREIGRGNAGRIGTHVNRHLPAGESYTTILEYIYHINRLVDICNGAKLAEYPVGSGHKPFQAIGSSDDDQLRWLLETLQWFSAWRAELQQDGDLAPAEKRASFLPTETWSALQSLCLGFNCLTKHYIDPYPGRKLVCRKCQSDCCEHHFANVKFFAGKGAAAGATIAVCYGGTAAAAASHLGGIAGGKANFSGELSTDIAEAKMWSQESIRAAREEYAQSQ